MRIDVPSTLLETHTTYFGGEGTAWIRALPHLAAELLDRWQLRLDGEPTCGCVAVIVPVTCADGTPAVLKLQPVDDETLGEPLALRTWNGDGAVRLLRHDKPSGAMLLERLHPRTLATVEDDLRALEVIAQLLAKLSAVRAPHELRRLDGVAAEMLERAPRLLPKVADPAERRMLTTCARATQELVAEAGDRLLHWDLHFLNVLASPDERGPWLAIDPKPLAGDPGFELLAALHNRWDDVTATGNVPRAVHRRFDLMTGTLGLDRQRATGWTLARILQNALWDIENEATSWHSEPDKAIARALLDR
ncbi:aminoglycoside phosphotransferase family protein [Flindersiella endophytica]